MIILESAPIGAGDTFARDAPYFALMIGVSARCIGWVGRMGAPLASGGEPNTSVCPETGAKYREMGDDTLEETM